MDIWQITLWTHLVGAAIWTGGSIVMLAVGGALVGNVKEDKLRRAFAAWMVAAWIGMVLAVGTGIAMTLHQDLDFGSDTMGLKLALVVAAAVVAVLDGWLLFRSPTWVQSASGVFLVIFNIGIFGAAVAL